MSQPLAARRLSAVSEAMLTCDEGWSARYEKRQNASAVIIIAVDFWLDLAILLHARCNQVSRTHACCRKLGLQRDPPPPPL